MKKIVALIFMISVFAVNAEGEGKKSQSSGNNGFGIGLVTNLNNFGLTMTKGGYRLDLDGGNNWFNLSLDKEIYRQKYLYVNVGAVLSTYQYDNYWTGNGWTEGDSGFDIGVRVPVGLSTNVNQFEFFGEVVPAFTIERGVDVDLALGFRFHF